MEGTHNNNNINNNSERDQQLLGTIKKQKGNVPTPLKIMAKRSGTLATFMAYHKQVFEDGPLSDRERSLVAVGTAVAMRSPQCIQTHSDYARKAGASEEEIIQAVMVASVMLGASPLRAAYSGLYGEE